MLRKESRRRSTKRFSAILPPPPSPNPENCEAFRNFDIFYLLSSPKTGSREISSSGFPCRGIPGRASKFKVPWRNVTAPFLIFIFRPISASSHCAILFRKPFSLPSVVPATSFALHLLTQCTVLCWLPLPRAGFLASTCRILGFHSPPLLLEHSPLLIPL